MFYLTTHSTHFIYGYMVSDHRIIKWFETVLIHFTEPAHFQVPSDCCLSDDHVTCQRLLL